MCGRCGRTLAACATDALNMQRDSRSPMPPLLQGSIMSTTIRLRCRILTAFLAALFASPVPNAADESGGAPPHFDNAVVAADHPAASEAGVEILRQGGNVVDAAVAVAFTLSVVRPESCGIGGGGFMIIWNAEEQQGVAIDYRERAPLAASRDMFTAADDQKPPSSREGGLAIAVPGDVAGLCYAVREYGTLELSQVLAPAIRLARDGVPIDRQMLSSRQSILKRLADDPTAIERYSALYTQYLGAGQAGEIGDLFHSPLADVLQHIAVEGPDGFYRGPVAAAIVAEVRRQGGILTLDDLAAMQPVVRTPLQGEFADNTIITMPPPSSGGVALLQILNVLSAYEQSHPETRLPGMNHNSPAYIHLVTEAMKHAFADRAEFLGDADFAEVPVADLISREYAARIADQIDRTTTQPLESYGRHSTPSDGGTSHFSVIDAAGNAVACTETINTTYGSLVVEPRFGIVLNNEMDDFAAVPGEPNAFGLIQSEANAVEPRKKPLSSMTPTIVVRDGRAIFAVGASGGPRIISATLQVLLNRLRFDMNVEDAVSAPRFHHQWAPEELLLEENITDETRQALGDLGHQTERRSGLAAAQAAAREVARLTGASDFRKGGKPAGY
ncbi:MAG: gamma-glutamyltransferase [Planctomycetota bacterium]|nr:MAG: gamma-glutamyltransferase [Planctomycetota bacterium]REK35678.1 MAG: gamma-glutamyltransferase [Planctomycetota bacterium]